MSKVSLERAAIYLDQVGLDRDAALVRAAAEVVRLAEEICDDVAVLTIEGSAIPDSYGDLRDALAAFDAA